MPIRRVPAVAVTALFALIAACSGDDGGAAGSRSAEATIGAEGGTLALGRASVEIPPGALEEPIDVRLSLVADGAAFSTPGVGDVYAVEPHGTEFLEPVIVRIPIAEADHVVVHISGDNAEQLERLHAAGTTIRGADLAGATLAPSVSDGIAAVEVQTFSWFFNMPNPMDIDFDEDGVTQREGDCEPANANVHPGAVEECDSWDNDCDGEVNNVAAEDVPDAPQVGICVGQKLSCLRRGFLPGFDWSMAAIPGIDTTFGPGERCDGQDDDCDGVIDDGCDVCAEGDTRPCGEDTGACEPGTQTCSDDGGWEWECVGGSGSAEESCFDDLDNDCDGVVNEGCDCEDGETQDCDDDSFGPCESGRASCEGGVWGECEAYEDPGVEACDGIDNDCNGEIDDVSPENTPLFELQEGICDGMPKVCGLHVITGDVTWLAPDALGYEAGEFTCDGLDNDCDGEVDEDMVGIGPDLANQEGVCAGGRQSCVNGEWADLLAAVDGYVAADDTCDGQDNDCSGEVTDIAPEDAREFVLQAGVCEGLKLVCEFNDSTFSYDWTLPAESPFEDGGEVSCDGLDNDCDGEVDEELVSAGPALSNQLGVCEGGRQSCVDGEWAEVLESVELYVPFDDTCDRHDNDCTGEVFDIAPEQARAFVLQDGVCEGLKLECVFDAGLLDHLWTLPDESPFEDGGEVTCDGLDNDCDGETDEELDGAGPELGNQLGVCEGGRQSCVDGEWVEVLDVIDEYQESDDRCDGVDSDCTGELTDIAPEHAPDFVLQAGVCEGLKLECKFNDSTFSYDWTLPAESPFEDGGERTCDGLNNDCDAGVDEGIDDIPADNALGACSDNMQTCAGVAGYQPADGNTEPTDETCDGVDEDCDGLVDEDFDADEDGFYDRDAAGCAEAHPGQLDCNDDNPGVRAACVRFVDAAAGGVGDGGAWADAFPDLQAAIDAALPGDEIWVAQGTYSPGTRRADSFELRDEVRVLGGFAGVEEAEGERDWRANETILSGAEFNNFQVVQNLDVTRSAVIDGFTIRDGNATSTGSNGWGGGMLNVRSSPTVVNCLFTNNGGKTGAGMMNSNGANPLVVNSRFEANTATITGGAVHSGQASIPEFIGVLFTGNEAPKGGALYSIDGSNVSLIHSTISGNTATTEASGLFIDNDTTPRLVNSVFWGDSVGGGINPGIPVFSSSCTSVFAGNTGENGNTLLDADPFLDSEAGDYRLAEGSPCVNSAADGAIPADTLDLDGDGDVVEPYPLDLDGSPRINGNVDSGPYERQ